MFLLKPKGSISYTCKLCELFVSNDTRFVLLNFIIQFLVVSNIRMFSKF